jgi:hypothetical protein
MVKKPTNPVKYVRTTYIMYVLCVSTIFVATPRKVHYKKYVYLGGY